MIEVGYERRDRIAYITLNRPEAKNAVTPEMHDELCRLWANFRDDDQADVAILTGVGDAFCAGADLATYVPSELRRRPTEPGARDRRPRLRRANPRPAQDPQARDRRDQRLGPGRRPRAGPRLRPARRLRSSDVRLLRGTPRVSPRRRRDHPARQHVRRRDGDAARPHRRADRRHKGAALQPGHERRAARRAAGTDTELVARQILRNSQRAVRSAKETILEVIGKPLDDQLRIEGWNSYTCVDRDEARELLRRFFDKTDVGRAGSNSTRAAERLSRASTGASDPRLGEERCYRRSAMRCGQPLRQAVHRDVPRRPHRRRSTASMRGRPASAGMRTLRLPDSGPRHRDTRGDLLLRALCPEGHQCRRQRPLSGARGEAATSVSAKSSRRCRPDSPAAPPPTAGTPARPARPSTMAVCG